MSINKETLKARLDAALPIIKEMAKVESDTWRSIHSLFSDIAESKPQTGVKTVGESFIKRLFG